MQLRRLEEEERERRIRYFADMERNEKAAAQRLALRLMEEERIERMQEDKKRTLHEDMMRAFAQTQADQAMREEQYRRMVRPEVNWRVAEPGADTEVNYEL